MAATGWGGSVTPTGNFSPQLVNTVAAQALPLFTQLAPLSNVQLSNGLTAGTTSALQQGYARPVGTPTGSTQATPQNQGQHSAPVSPEQTATPNSAGAVPGGYGSYQDYAKATADAYAKAKANPNDVGAFNNYMNTVNAGYPGSQVGQTQLGSQPYRVDYGSTMGDAVRQGTYPWSDYTKNVVALEQEQPTNESVQAQGRGVNEHAQATGQPTPTPQNQGMILDTSQIDQGNQDAQGFDKTTHEPVSVSASLAYDSPQADAQNSISNWDKMFNVTGTPSQAYMVDQYGQYWGLQGAAHGTDVWGGLAADNSSTKASGGDTQANPINFNFTMPSTGQNDNYGGGPNPNGSNVGFNFDPTVQGNQLEGLGIFYHEMGEQMGTTDNTDTWYASNYPTGSFQSDAGPVPAFTGNFSNASANYWSPGGYGPGGNPQGAPSGTSATGATPAFNGVSQGWQTTNSGPPAGSKNTDLSKFQIDGQPLASQTGANEYPATTMETATPWSPKPGQPINGGLTPMWPSYTNSNGVVAPPTSGAPFTSSPISTQPPIQASPGPSTTSPTPAATPNTTTTSPVTGQPITTTAPPTGSGPVTTSPSAPSGSPTTNSGNPSKTKNPYQGPNGLPNVVTFPSSSPTYPWGHGGGGPAPWYGDRGMSGNGFGRGGPHFGFNHRRPHTLGYYSQGGRVNYATGGTTTPGTGGTGSNWLQNMPQTIAPSYPGGEWWNNAVSDQTNHAYQQWLQAEQNKQSGNSGQAGGSLGNTGAGNTPYNPNDPSMNNGPYGWPTYMANSPWPSAQVVRQVPNLANYQGGNQGLGSNYGYGLNQQANSPLGPTPSQAGSPDYGLSSPPGTLPNLSGIDPTFQQWNQWESNNPMGAWDFAAGLANGNITQGGGGSGGFGSQNGVWGSGGGFGGGGFGGGEGGHDRDDRWGRGFGRGDWDDRGFGGGFGHGFHGNYAAYPGYQSWGNNGGGGGFGGFNSGFGGGGFGGGWGGGGRGTFEGWHDPDHGRGMRDFYEDAREAGVNLGGGRNNNPFMNFGGWMNPEGNEGASFGGTNWAGDDKRFFGFGNDQNEDKAESWLQSNWNNLWNNYNQSIWSNNPATKNSSIPNVAHGGLMDTGGHVPGQAEVQGDNEKNDTVKALLSPGEIVIPRSVANSPDAPQRSAQFVAAVLAKSNRKGSLSQRAS